jgi:O-antigen ligase
VAGGVKVKSVRPDIGSSDARGVVAVQRPLKVDLLTIGFFYLGATILTSETSTLSLTLWRIDLPLLVALGCAFVGWRRLLSRPRDAQAHQPLVAMQRDADPIAETRRSSVLTTYTRYAVVLGAWALIGWVAEWQFAESEYYIRLFVLTIVVIVPGLSYLLRTERYRTALIAGIVAEATVYASVAMFRLASGRGSMFDFPGRVGTVVVLDMGRNALNVLALIALPLLARGKRWSIGPRIGLFAVLFMFIIFSGSRGGLLGLVFVGLVYIVLQARGSRVLRTTYAALLVGLVAFTFISSTGGQATESSNRVLSTFRGERSENTEARELLIRKALHLAARYPVFGVGLGDFAETYDPVVEEASSERVRNYVGRQPDEHNTYAETLAEIGIPGFLLFIAILAVLVRAGTQRRAITEVHLITVSLIGLLFQFLFVGQLARSAMFGLPAALLLGAIGDDQRDQSPLRRGSAALS